MQIMPKITFNFELIFFSFQNEEYQEQAQCNCSENQNPFREVKLRQGLFIDVVVKQMMTDAEAKEQEQDKVVVTRPPRRPRKRDLEKLRAEK